MAVIKQPNPELQPRLAGTNYEEATQRAPLLVRNERGLRRTIVLGGEVIPTLACCEHTVKGTAPHSGAVSETSSGP